MLMVWNLLHMDLKSIKRDNKKENIYNVQNRTRKTLDWGIWLKLY